ncbi:MAG: Xaa-Pro peptidase family protein [Alphaproteobacteria bacterium]|nr:Xaa-Pro peptidase family protein [Alphaproteobacteria bacterium]
MDATFGTEDSIARITLAEAGVVEMNQHDRLGFSLAEYQRRVEDVLARMGQSGLDVLLVRGPENITWLTGYESPGYYKYHCVILAPGIEPVFVLRRFEELNIPEYAWLTRHVPLDDWEHPPTVTARTLRELGLAAGRVGVEKQGWFFTVDEYETLAAALPEAKFVDATRVVEEARLIKSAEEIAIMRRAAAILDKAVQAGMDKVGPGISDDLVNAEVNRMLLENGGEYMGLPPFILSGPRTSLPHQTARSERIGDHDVVYFEVSCSQYRYAAALMRTMFVGEPDPAWRRCGEAVIAGLEAALETIRPGVACAEVDRAARSVIESAGFGEYFRHRLGYSIGVNYPPDWGEGQILSLHAEERRLLEPNMTFHLVPLCLVYREFGFGCSETVRVTEDGCERFSSLSRGIRVV